jgi:CheY-like chemotaxis protein
MADSQAPWRARTRPVRILLVEDSPTDALIMREILEQASPPSNLHVVEDGLRALRFLRSEPGDEQAPRPDLILLDWKLPRKSGEEVLDEIKADARLRTIPVVVLTSSHDPHDVISAYHHGANCYVTKPVDYTRFADVLRLIGCFWLELATLAEQD